MTRSLSGRLWNAAWPVLVLANLLWAGNIVLGRGMAGTVPPVTLAFCRWGGAFLVALPFAWPLLRRDLPVLLRHWRLMLVLSATGIATYNTLSYISLTQTTALNVLLLQSAMPLIILVWAFALFGDRPSLRQTAGILVSLTGVAVIAGHGSMTALRHLTLNRGDVIILVAMVVYGVYCVLFRRRPAVHPLAFLTATMGIGSVMILPFFMAEIAAGGRITGGPATWLGLAYVAVFPSFVAYLLFNRGIELAGAGLAGQSMHLMPLFGSILAVLFLGEEFRMYHAMGIAFIAAGILLASWPSGRIAVARAEKA